MAAINYHPLSLHCLSPYTVPKRSARRTSPSLLTEKRGLNRRKTSNNFFEVLYFPCVSTSVHRWTEVKRLCKPFPHPSALNGFQWVQTQKNSKSVSKFFRIAIRCHFCSEWTKVNADHFLPGKGANFWSPWSKVDRLYQLTATSVQLGQKLGTNQKPLYSVTVWRGKNAIKIETKNEKPQKKSAALLMENCRKVSPWAN